MGCIVLYYIILMIHTEQHYHTTLHRNLQGNRGR